MVFDYNFLEWYKTIQLNVECVYLIYFTSDENYLTNFIWILCKMFLKLWLRYLSLNQWWKKRDKTSISNVMYVKRKNDTQIAAA